MTHRLRDTVHSWSLALALPLGALTGCPAGNDATTFRAAIPTRDTVAVTVPGSAGQALTITESAATLGRTSEFYRLTRNVSRVVNGGTLATLALVKTVVSFPPTRLTADGAVWGPWTGALEPNAWKVTVSRLPNDTYSYKFEGKGKRDPDAAFVTVLSGVHTPSLDAAGDPIEGFGKGTFTMDWDAAQALPEHDDNVGQATISYDRSALAAPMGVEAAFRRIRDKDANKIVDVDYKFVRLADDSGTLDFVYTAPVTTHPSAESFAVKSRWKPVGAGRADVRMSGGDFLTPATANECWDTAFASVYLNPSWAPTEGYGSEAACPFIGADYSTLKP